MTATAVPTDIPNSRITAGLPLADSSITTPTTTALMVSTTGE